jgi:hypothetical protein
MRLRLVPSVRIVWRHVAAAIALASQIASAGAWEFAHGNRDNTGFANVATSPAGKGSRSVPDLGKFAHGAGPVVANDGTVYLGTIEGKVIALHADGSPYWSRDISARQSIVASPAISSDGSVYVIGVNRVRKAHAPEDMTFNATLHHFTGSGGSVQQIAFPQHGGIGPSAFSPPNIWRSGSAEALMVPAVYPNKVTGGYAVRLIAFSLSGQVLDDVVVRNVTPETTGGGDFFVFEAALCFASMPGWALCPALSGGYNPTRVPNFLVTVPPMPGVGIFTQPGGGAPFILVSDHYKDLVGYTFSGQRITETFRVHENNFFMRTPPMILNGHTLMGQEAISRGDNGAEKASGRGRIIFAGPNMTPVAPAALTTTVHSAPTRMADGRVALVDAYGNVVILKDNQPTGNMTGAGRSIASAAASLSHIFVSGENGFVTFDANTLAEVSRFDWVGGGLNPPVIGPKGHVYAIASNILFVFPPKLTTSTIRQPQSGLTIAPTAEATSVQEKEYKPPMTTNGNPLFACEELDQDDCGKGDHKDISLAWCQKEGYPLVKEYDVDSKKVKAETLDGRFCSKSKCKVFDQIVCAN